MQINRNISSYNFNVGAISRVKYLVIHFTANNGDTAYNNTVYFQSYRGASAHYFVDENSMWQSVEDKNIAWHVGAASYRHKECRNTNSIGIELCSRIAGGAYYFKDETVDNAVELTRYLMKKYKVPVSRVVRHYDVTGKVCPEPFVRNTAAWNNFIKRLEEEEEMVEQVTMIINGKETKVDRILKDGRNYVALGDISIIQAGYDANTKLVSIDHTVEKANVNIDGKEVEIPAIFSQDRNYVQLKSLEEQGVLQTKYDTATKQIEIMKA